MSLPSDWEQITPVKFYQMWNDSEIYDAIPVTLSGKHYMIGKTTIGQADNPKGYKVVWVQLPA